MENTRIQVRPMLPEEKLALARIMRRAFSPIQQLFFSWKGSVLVAEQEGQLLGGTVLDTFDLPEGRKGGIVLWIFTDPDARGLGAGQALTEAAIAHFKTRNCSDMFACVEGYNTSSSKLFATRGFEILSPGAQFRRYGLGTFAMWYHTFHFIDVGHFLWTRPPAAQPDSPALQWWGTLLVNTLILWLALWRQSGFGQLPLPLLVAAPLSLLLFLGLRSLGMLVAARAQGMDVRYRAWESGFPLSTLIALFMGGLYVVPGSYYPNTDVWRYRDRLPQLGRMALAGILPTLLLTWGLWAWGEFGTPVALSPWLAAGYQVAFMVGVLMSILDVLTVFFPLASFNGRRVWDWQRWLWGLLALAVVALLFV